MALERGSNKALGFCLNEDMCDAAEDEGEEGTGEQSEDNQNAGLISVAFALLGELEGSYLADHPTVVASRGTTLHIVATGATADVAHGAALAAQLEAHALGLARERGFAGALTVCTNAATEVLAREAGFVECGAVEYDSWEHAGKGTVLRDKVPPPHKRAVLMFREL